MCDLVKKQMLNKTAEMITSAVLRLSVALTK